MFSKAVPYGFVLRIGIQIKLIGSYAHALTAFYVELQRYAPSSGKVLLTKYHAPNVLPHSPFATPS